MPRSKQAPVALLPSRAIVLPPPAKARMDALIAQRHLLDAQFQQFVDGIVMGAGREPGQWSYNTERGELIPLAVE